MSARSNPWRQVAGKDTKTWLPDDAGKLSRNTELQWKNRGKKIDPWTSTSAEVEVSKSPRVTLVDAGGRTVVLKKLGKGHWTTAYLGDDGWVYLFTRQEGLRDPAKDVLVDFTHMYGDEPSSVHVPWVEKIGEVVVGRKGYHDVYRMPRYEKIPAGSTNAKYAARLNKAVAKTADHSLPPTNWYKWKQRQLDAIAAADVPDSVKEAIQNLADYVTNYGDGWLFEFPKRNMMQDADGNLVLLDVIFDAQALAEQRHQMWKKQRGF